MTEQGIMRLAELISERYVRAGFTKTQAILTIHLQSGVSVQSVRSASTGWRVQLGTARRLDRWAKKTHCVSLDVAAMVAAPKRRKG